MVGLNPEQAADRSKAAARRAPIAFWMMQAVAGNRWSGVAVQQMTRSTSSASIPALCSALR